jgi:GxxExxY protein
MDIEKLNGLTQKIICCAIEVHKYLDPGLLESSYEDCESYELSIKEIYQMNLRGSLWFSVISVSP